MYDDTEDLSVEDRIKRIIGIWFLSEPLYFSIYCTHNLCVNSTMKVPVRCGKMRIEYNPKLLEDVSDIMLEELLKVEIIRIILKHPYGRQPPMANKMVLGAASDVTIADNYDTVAPLLKSSELGIEQNLAFQQYYQRIRDLWNENNSMSGMGEEDSEDSGENENSSSSGNLSKEQMEDLKEKLQRGGESSDLWQEDDTATERINGEIEKARNTNSWGSVSGDLQELIEASLIIKMDYRQMLRNFRASILSTNRTLTRTKPNRRYGFSYMGSKYDFTTRLLVGVDVSGSVDDKDLQNFFSIINRFFKYGIKGIDVLQFDCELKEIIPFKRAKKSVKILGRGGTDFDPVIDYFKKHSEYDGLVIFTDGYADTPTVTENRKILWVFTSEDAYNDAQKWVGDIKNSKSTYIPSIK